MSSSSIQPPFGTQYRRYDGAILTIVGHGRWYTEEGETIPTVLYTIDPVREVRTMPSHELDAVISCYTICTTSSVQSDSIQQYSNTVSGTSTQRSTPAQHTSARQPGIVPDRRAGVDGALPPTARHTDRGGNSPASTPAMPGLPSPVSHGIPLPASHGIPPVPAAAQAAPGVGVPKPASGFSSVQSYTNHAYTSTREKMSIYQQHPQYGRTSLERFFYWIEERHSIYKKRLMDLPKPWTNDPIFQDYFFCNPYRENDTVTAWFRERLRDPYREDWRSVWATLMMRTFVYPPLIGELIDAGQIERWDPEVALSVINDRIKRGEQWHTGAYTIATSGTKGPKQDHLVRNVLDVLWHRLDEILTFLQKNRDAGRQSLQRTHQYLTASKLPNLGGSGFNAYEVVCDLRYTAWLEDADDVDTWSNCGPGARRGLNRVQGQPFDQIERTIPDDEYQARTGQLLLQVRKRLSKMPTFEMREIEHSLCELDKYERILFQQGQSKRKYDGRR